MHTPATAPASALAERAYPGAPEQISAVRADLRALLGDSPIADDVILCASELATNAALHSRSRKPGAQFTVRAEIHPGDYAWIEVEDDGGQWTQTPASPARAHGLDIIRALAADWGIDGDDASWTVWARIDWPGYS